RDLIVTGVQTCALPISAGAAGVPLAVDRLSLHAAADGEWLTLATGGATAHADSHAAHAIFQQKTIRLRVDLGLGRAEAVVWTCEIGRESCRERGESRGG